MRPGEALALLNLTLPPLSGERRRLAAAHTIAEFRSIARRRLPRSVFDYVDGGANEEHSLRGNASAIRAWQFHPRALVDVTDATTATTILGHPAAAPIGFAPTGYTRMISPLGEPAVAAAAARCGLPYVLSTMATTSLEDLARDPGAGETDRWFQLYVWKDRRVTHDLIQRAADNGYRVLEIAIDTAVSGMRVRDVRNGFTIPPQLTPGSVLDIGLKPNYWMGMLRSPALEFANVSGGTAGSDEPGGFTIDNISQQFDPAVSWDDIADIRERWHGKLVVKGPLGPDDAVRAQELGVDGVHLSNHGGRQLDRTVAPIDLVAPVRAAVGPEFSVFVDSGFSHGDDIAVALALGADAVFVGRAYLWGLVAAGAAGVARVGSLLTTELRRAMQLLGVTSVEQLRAHGASLVQRSAGSAAPHTVTARTGHTP
ncbi:L-lactate dehydrogenase [Leucobacter sp. 7(1)]|uniref:alpha-hydroxy acid oxidase n=1 Tax=Leucobacter sp. 7(1) TaxID=1255613 RepID=UPI00097F5860|nr:alpha-hydroxy acid oxidase [Leucobacter sp. 7(1)]SJN08079.1 L-lactate dehydrogenase [Leucobacter sp. 7(1)]